MYVAPVTVAAGLSTGSAAAAVDTGAAMPIALRAAATRTRRARVGFLADLALALRCVELPRKYSDVLNSDRCLGMYRCDPFTAADGSASGGPQGLASLTSRCAPPARQPPARLRQAGTRWAGLEARLRAQPSQLASRSGARWPEGRVRTVSAFDRVRPRCASSCIGCVTSATIAGRLAICRTISTASLTRAGAGGCSGMSRRAQSAIGCSPCCGGWWVRCIACRPRSAAPTRSGSRLPCAGGWESPRLDDRTLDRLRRARGSS